MCQVMGLPHDRGRRGRGRSYLTSRSVETLYKSKSAVKLTKLLLNNIYMKSKSMPQIVECFYKLHKSPVKFVKSKIFFSDYHK